MRRVLPDMQYVFCYGTLKTGFPNHAAHAHHFECSLGMFQTLQRYPLIVPNQPMCTNPSCRFNHRMGALVERPGEGAQIWGEVFGLKSGALGAIDALENYLERDVGASTYLRRCVQVRSADLITEVGAFTYFVKNASPYLDLLGQSMAQTYADYSLAMAQGALKWCCVNDPGHAGLHDVGDPLLEG